MRNEIKIIADFLKGLGELSYDFYSENAIELREVSDVNFEKIIDFISDMEERYGFMFQIFVMKSSFVIVSL